MAARVGDAPLRKPFYVDGATDLVSVCRQLADRERTDALVRDGDRLGIFTTTDLRDALLLGVPPERAAGPRRGRSSSRCRSRPTPSSSTR